MSEKLFGKREKIQKQGTSENFFFLYIICLKTHAGTFTFSRLSNRKKEMEKENKKRSFLIYKERLLPGRRRGRLSGKRRKEKRKGKRRGEKRKERKKKIIYIRRNASACGDKLYHACPLPRSFPAPYTYIYVHLLRKYKEKSRFLKFHKQHVFLPIFWKK